MTLHAEVSGKVYQSSLMLKPHGVLQPTLTGALKYLCSWSFKRFMSVLHNYSIIQRKMYVTWKRYTILKRLKISQDTITKSLVWVLELSLLSQILRSLILWVLMQHRFRVSLRSTFRPLFIFIIIILVIWNCYRI